MDKVLEEEKQPTPSHLASDQVSESVTLEEHENPQNLPKWRKWLIVTVISATSSCITSAAGIAAYAENGMTTEFHVPHLVAVLSISLYVGGLGVGPFLAGPLSETFGRNPIYRISFGLCFLLSWPVAFAPNIATLLVFRFLLGVSGAAFLVVSGGSVSDLFSDNEAASPMAVYTVSLFLGPVIGPLLSGFVNQNLNWRWTYYVVVIWNFGQFILLLLCVPETYLPALIRAKARTQEKKGGKQAEDIDWQGIRHAVRASCSTPFKHLYFDTMALFLDIWNSLILGIQYLAFQVYTIIFQEGHGFNTQQTGMGFLGVGVGLLFGLMTQPFWNRFYEKTARKNGGKLAPEVRLYMGQVGAICVPVGLYWLAFTTYPSVPWIIPVIASVPFGTGVYFVFSSTFTYLITTYRPIAASSMSANVALSSVSAAVFPLFAGTMYDRLGTVGATALLAGLTTIMAPLPFVLVRIGPRLRSQSRYAASG